MLGKCPGKEAQRTMPINVLDNFNTIQVLFFKNNAVSADNKDIVSICSPNTHKSFIGNLNRFLPILPVIMKYDAVAFAMFHVLFF